MGLLTLVGSLMNDPGEGIIFSGYMTLPRPLPAGVSLRVVAVPKPYRGRKEKYELHVAIPLHEPPEIKDSSDLIIKGEIMGQYFRQPRPPGKRYKIMLWGDTGTAKSLSALGFPKCAYIDNHGSVEPYEPAYPDHLYFRPNGVDDTMNAVTSLLQDPGDRLTVVLDDVTTYWGDLQIKWTDLFLKRLPRSKGHHAEFYAFQPSDWVHPKREMKSLVQRLIACDLNAVMVARSTKQYAGTGDLFMKVLGEVFAGEKNLIYEFDFIFRLVLEEGKRFAVVNKQRVPAGGKPFPEKFDFNIDKKGQSTFYSVFQKYAIGDYLSKEAHTVDDPVKDEFPKEPEPEHTGATLPLINEAQLSTLKEKKDYYKITNEEWGKTLMKLYNVKTAKALNTIQADAFIEYLDTARTPF